MVTTNAPFKRKIRECTFLDWLVPLRSRVSCGAHIVWALALCALDLLLVRQGSLLATAHTRDAKGPNSEGAAGWYWLRAGAEQVGK